MKITIVSTEKVVDLNGVQARVWEGFTDSEIPVHCFIVRIGVRYGQDTSQFERELKECAPPSEEVAAIPLRLVL